MIDAQYEAIKNDPKFRDYYQNPTSADEKPATEDYWQNRERLTGDRLIGAQEELDKLNKDISATEAELTCRRAQLDPSVPTVRIDAATIEAELELARNIVADGDVELKALAIDEVHRLEGQLDQASQQRAIGDLEGRLAAQRQNQAELNTKIGTLPGGNRRPPSRA